MTAQPYRKESTLDNEELQKLTRHWQERLRLNDWIIESWVTYKKDLPGEHRDAEGLVNYNIEKKQAEIVVLHPDDAPQMIPHDMEAVLVHELLHLHFAPFTNDDPLVEVLIEQSIESITAALMNTERDQVVRFDTAQDRALAEKEELIRELQRDRDRYREKTLILQQKLDDFQKKYDQQNNDMAYVSENRQETAKENIRLRKRIKELEAHADHIASQASAEYHQGVEDALRRHQNGPLAAPSMAAAKDGARDVSTHSINVDLTPLRAALSKELQKHPKDHQPTDYEDEPTIYEERDDE